MEVAFGDDADQLARIVQHRQAADMAPQHDIGGVGDRGARRNADDIPGHDLMGAHGLPPFKVIRQA